MTPITHNCLQGSAEWLQLRAKYFTASEASAMMGVSKHQTRTALLRAKSTGLVEDIDAGKQRLFDAGHAAEAAARPIIEAQLGEELYNVTMSAKIDGLPLLASLDGITMMGDVIWENKLLNASLKDAVDNGDLPLHYAYQIEQQMLVSGATKAYFTTSDGTESGTFGMWYESDPVLVQKLIEGWKQFSIDLAAYVPEEVKPAAVAEIIEDLPALTVQLVGHVAASNLATFQTVVLGRIKAINTTLVTDSDFATADKMVKFLDDGEKRLDLVKAQALSQTASIYELFRTIDSLKAEMKSKRLTLDKLVKAEKENRKAEICVAAHREFSDHLAALLKRTGIAIPAVGNFGEAIKGLKSLDSMRDKVSVSLANAKIEANAIADRIEANKRQLVEVDAMSLFPDFSAVCTKAPEDFDALLSMRVNQRKDADAKRLEAERERIRAEEQAKAQREQSEKAAAEKAEANRLAAEEIRRIDEQRKAEAMAVAQQLAEEAKAAAPDEAQKQPAAGHIEQPLVLVVSETHAPANDCLPRIKLGEICARLGYTVSAEFLATIGFEPVATDKNAKLYNESSFPGICRRIADHTLRVAMTKKAA